ncbi:MAG: SRPBCC family protein [Thermomicrobiales bacterium]
MTTTTTTTTATTTNQLTVTAEPGSHSITMTREFDAPPALVLRAHTEPDLLKQWLGPHGYEMIVETYEPVHGGSYRYLHRDAEGNEFAFRGVFHGTPSVDGLVQTFEWEGAPGQVSLDQMQMVDLGGRTRIVTTSVFPTVEMRDALIENGMETGVREGYDRLDGVLATLATA